MQQSFCAVLSELISNFGFLRQFAMFIKEHCFLVSNSAMKAVQNMYFKPTYGPIGQGTVQHFRSMRQKYVQKVCFWSKEF